MKKYIPTILILVTLIALPITTRAQFTTGWNASSTSATRIMPDRLPNGSNPTVVGSNFEATSTSASSTFANGLNLTKGCFSILGTCIGGSSITIPLPVSQGGTGLTELKANFIPFGNGTNAFATSSVFIDTPGGLDYLVVGTSTLPASHRNATLQAYGNFSGTTITQQGLRRASFGMTNTDQTDGNFEILNFNTFDSTGSSEINMSRIVSQTTSHAAQNADLVFMTAFIGGLNERMRITSGGNVGIGTTSPGTVLSLGTTGGINFDPTATSSFGSSANGINLTNGCFAVNGACVTGGGSGLSGGTAGMLMAWTGATTATATSGPTAAYYTATSTKASQFPYASSTAITVSDTASTTKLIVSNIAAIGAALNSSYSLNTGSSINAATGTAYFLNGYKMMEQHVYDADPTSNSVFFAGSGPGTAGGWRYGNVGFGSSALAALTIGTNNFSFGSHSLELLTSGSDNIAIGGAAGSGVTIGAENIFIGQQSGQKNTGSDNTFVGFNAGQWNLASGSGSSGNNVGIGAYAIPQLNTGSQKNVAIGYTAGYTVTTGKNLTCLGFQTCYVDDDSNVTPNNLTNASAIGFQAQVGCSNCLVLGDVGTNKVNVGMGTTSPWAKLSVVGATSPVLVIATSTAGNSSKPIFQVDATNEIKTAGPQPAVSACGVTPSISATSNDTSGQVTVGSGVTTACTITYAKTKTGNTHVFVEVEGGTAIASSVSAHSGTAFTVTFAATLGSGVFDYWVVSDN